MSVLASEEYVGTLEKRLGNSPVGICILTKKGTISEKKEPQEYSHQLNKDTMFRILRKPEYEEIIIKHYGMLPNVSQFDYYRTCKRLFCEIETNVAYEDFISTLKKRGKIDTEYYKKSHMS
ncbi:hypothetical protein D3C78_1377070 [compost metagenome]